jgi:hypothetical protein
MLLFPGDLRGLQGSGRLVVSVDDPRPLAAAVTFLQQRFKWTITYEDPRFEHPDDIEDVTASVRRDGDLSKRVLVPKGGRFSVTYDLPETPDPRDVLTRLLNEYAQSGYPGRFSVIETSGVFHVIPTEIRDRTGAQKRNSSILATAVSLPERDRSLLELVEEVLEQVQSTSGHTVKLGSVPLNLMRRPTREGVSGENASAVLARVLATDETKMSWQLLYGADTRMYFLNLGVIPSP